MKTYKHWTEDYLYFDGYTNQWVALSAPIGCGGIEVVRGLDKEKVREVFLQYDLNELQKTINDLSQPPS